MYVTSRAALIAGVALIIFALLVIVFVAGQADIAGDDPFEKSEVSQFLTTIEKNKAEVRVAFAFAIAIDACIVLVVAAVTYVLFRDRSHLLAALAFAGFVANGAVSGVADGVGLVLTFVADDYVNGGPGNLAAGDSSILEVGRAMGMTLRTLTSIQVTSFGVAQLSLGALLAFAPTGAINPPRIFGWISIVTGAAAIIAWGIVAADWFFLFLILNTLGSLVFMFGLGGWLIMNRHLSPPASAWYGSET